uniref:F-box domain-containing protein n=1 Tax=Panagrellus redivivus TaxID=6233 RepID=A0A7E4VWA5_PANRE
MPLIEYENNNLPYSNLPYAFKRRLIQLASLGDAKNISIACSDLKTLHKNRRKCYTNVYITDNNYVCNAAVRKAKTEHRFRLLRYLPRFCWLRYLSDGPVTINPTWQTVLPVGKIIDENKPLYINDTLILYFLSVDSYARLMPLVAGSYTRLVLYGQFTWAQVESLIHANVKQVRIMGNVEVEPEEYDNVIKFVLRFPRGADYK